MTGARKPPPLRHGELAPRRLWARAARGEVENAIFIARRPMFSRRASLWLDALVILAEAA